MKIGIVSGVYLNYPIEETIRRVAGAGYDTIDIWSGRPHLYRGDFSPADDRRLRQLVDEQGLAISSFLPAFYRYPYSLSIPSEIIRQDSIQYMKECLDHAVQLGAPILLVVPERTLYGQSVEDGWKRLADSIRQHGLISPISVRQPRPDETIPSGIEYLIVTGERRYWAQTLLTSRDEQIQEGDTLADPAQIKATIAPAGVTVRAHQLIENLLREDINAVEKARGMWALRYELSGLTAPTGEVNHGSPPTGEAELVPWTRVEKTLGISKRYRIFMTSVLNLSPEALAVVTDYDLAERAIRPIVQKLKGKPELQVQALNQLVAWQAEDEADSGGNRSIGGAVKALVDQLLAGESQDKKSEETKTRAVSSAPVIRFRSKIRQTLDFLNRLKPADRDGLTQALEEKEQADLMVDLRNLRQQIDVILDSASQQVDEKMTPPEAGTEDIT